MGPRRSRAPERLVLALALVAAAALGAAALVPGQDPDVAARASLAQLAGEVEDAVSAEWLRALRDLPARLDGRAPDLRWGDGTPAVPPPPAADAEPESLTYAALAGDAESERDPARAVELARAALEQARGGRARADSLLRLAQVASRARDEAAAVDAWGAARGTVPGSIASGGVATRLAIFLAASEWLDPLERARDAGDLAVAWSRGEIALPIASDAGIDPRVEVLAERLAEAAGPGRESVSALLARSEPRLRAASLELATGPLPSSCEGTAWSVVPRGASLLASRASSSGGCEGFLLEPTEARRVLLDSAAPLLPAEFALDAVGDGPGEALRPRVELVPGSLGYTLRHADVSGWIARGSARARWMRGGLVALSALCAVAGLVAARALARERHLAELRTAFVAGVSHELRTPVASILLLAENLQSGRVEGEAGRARYHELIRREALRLRRLVDGVLDFSRLERGRGVEIAREDVDVAAWLASLADEAREWARQHDLELDVRIGDVSGGARLDREALRRALWNLLENAQRHSGSRQVALRARRDGADLVLEVEDQGRGVPPARRAAIFEPFTRFAEPGTPGTGLGLALVREIARAHAGSIDVVTGENGTGACFRLRVPAEPEEER